MKINNQAEYNAAKKTLEIPHVDFIMNAQGLRDQMLEYRRANNIFEVGDYVLFPIACEKGGKYFGKIIDYRSDINQFDVLGSRHWGWFTSSELQHANDAEIKAKRRLDLPESVVQSLGEVS